MRRLVTGFALFLAGSYGVLHLVLGSSPVQRRVVAELQQALSEYGLTLQMESIEFSALSPKIYINRVKIESTPTSKIHLNEPLTIDKIKIQFSPFALLLGKIGIDELILFHPRIEVPRADKFYKAVTVLFGGKGAIEVERPSFDVVFYKMGVVDALVNIESQDPPFAVRSRSLTVIVEKGSGQQKSIVVQSDNLELAWEKYQLALNKVDVDADLGSHSVRLNKGVIENAEFAINLVGVSKLPTETEKVPHNINASYEIKLKLPFLRNIPDVKLPKLTGSISSTGTVRKEGEIYGGKGQLSYEGLSIDNVGVGSGNLAFALDKHKANISQVNLHYSGGDFKSNKLEIELGDHFPIQGELAFQGLLLEEILHAVGIKDSPVAMGASGQIHVTGTFSEPFSLRAEVDGKFTDLVALADDTKPRSEENSIVHFGSGSLKGPLTFTKDKMDFEAQLHALGGTLKGSGFIGFEDQGSKVIASGENVSLTQIGHIATLELGGVGRVEAEVIANKQDSHVSGKFDLKDAKVAGLDLGPVKGEAFYQGDLLTFENLELPSLDPVLANGYVDFKGAHTRYKFYVNARRMEMTQVFTLLKNVKFGIELPQGGEVSSRATIEGGESGKSVVVNASGTAKNFQWFDEKWVSSSFALSYADGTLDVSKALLTKPSGALELRGSFGKAMHLQLATFGLEISHFEHFGNAPLTGEVAGRLVFDGDKRTLFHNGRGELKLVKTKFRGVPIPDSTVTLKPDKGNLEYLFNLGSDRLRGRYVRSPTGKNDEVLLYFQDYDFAPLLTLVLSRDLPPMSDLRATGDLSAKGNFDDISSINGSGTISQLLVGFKGTPMRISHPAQIKLDHTGIRVDSIFLQGEDSQLALALNYEPDRKLDARIDGRIDLQYLQPFVPGLEYGAGKVSVGLRLSGLPSRYQLLGNAALEGGTFRMLGFNDEFRSVDMRLSMSQEKINIDKFTANLNGGTVSAEGEVRLDRFKTLNPNVRLRADRVVMHFKDFLSGKFSGDFTIRGKNRPYQFAGRCEIHEGSLTKFQGASSGGTSLMGTPEVPLFTFDIQCLAPQKLMVSTEIMQSELRGNLHLVGDNVNLGLLGNIEAVRGFVFFKDTRFNLDSASVKFESPTEILPRFRVAGRANVREIKNYSTGGASASGSAPTPVQEVINYEIALQAFGTPNDYKLRLSSTPPLVEQQIISLLILGVTGDSTNLAGQQYGSALGGALMGQIPLQSKLKNELGVNVNIQNQLQPAIQSGSNLNPGAANSDVTAPVVQIQKQISDKTKLTYSNVLDTVPIREFRIEQMLDDHVTLNGAAMERTRGTSTQATPSVGLDIRYRFGFE